ncbi:coiled-coil domain-containing protein R3HCC1L [Cajanus cajan]|uniref:R3H and coiled-coil domain-containing protein 1 n=1 Tax=Cajanus cajan TaxID=3821 RepID=A0A151R949_CAJCA|nr:coiled-coil domain-containing protein R3HCC1L [Cajanus cajan]KYP39062.1 R3H and coiled-coil domain-containing protein 1 [Cajanus cajan]
MEKVKEKEKVVENWSEAVEDLVDAGDVESAISLLESVVETLNPSDSPSQLQLASALSDLANLYSSKGFSLKADHLHSRASLLRHSTRQRPPKEEDRVVESTTVASQGSVDKRADLPAPTSAAGGSSDEDWEAIADLEPDELLPAVSSDCSFGMSNLKLENKKSGTPKRRGRGTFSYEKQELYSDQLVGSSVVDVEREETQCSSEDNRDVRNSKYGTSHVLVLADFSPSTRTTELEKLFEDFKDRGFVIRWVNDTVALAVFRTPSVALEALNSVRCSFTTRILDEDDTLLSSIKARDLEPPRQRPKTSAEAAQRLIARGMGLKLSSTSVGSQDYRKQEDARRERIVNRQKMRDEAWGDD